MADGDRSSTNVFTRGLMSIRDAVTGSDDEQTPAGRTQDDEQTPAGRTQDDEQTPRAVTDERNPARQQRAEEYAGVMEQCGAGDLTVRMEAGGDDEPIDRIALAFNEMVTDMETTTGHLKSYVTEVESAGVGIERSSDTVRRASEDVVDSMQNISADT